jgi:hypothetical protein
MLLKHVITGTILALALASIAGAQPAAPPGPPAELDKLDYFAGTWHCTGKAFANPMGPEHATTATVHADREVGGRWLHARYDEDKTAANPTPYHVGVYMGYDAGKKQFVQGCVDVFGGYCTQTSSGWSGDELVFEGAVSGSPDGKPAVGRDSFTNKGADHFVHTGAMQGADKSWVKTDQESCHKAK